MDEFAKELELLQKYNDLYYEDVKAQLDDMYYYDRYRYNLFVECYQKCRDMYGDNIRWEQIFENLLISFSNQEFGNLIDSASAEDLSAENIQTLNAILFEATNIYEIKDINDLQNATSIKQNILNKLFQSYIEGRRIEQLKSENKMVDNKITTETEFLKDIIFRKVFNLSYSQAEDIINSYGQNIKNVTGIDESLTTLINNLNIIYNTNDLDILTKMFQDSPTADINMINNSMLERLLASSYSSIYNQASYKPNDRDFIGKLEDGTPVYEVGTEFYMTVHSLGGVFENNTRQYRQDWQNRKKPFISTSFIGNRNMNTCPVNNVCYGFCSFNSNDILDVGFMNLHVSDAISIINPRSNYKSGAVNHVKYAMPQEFLRESMTYQWNEIGYRRFSGDGGRMYPDYIVFFSDGPLNPNDKNNQIWLNSVQAAREFSIPIVVINKQRINEYNQNHPYQNEFKPNQTVYFDNSKLNAIMTSFAENVLKTKTSSHVDIPPKKTTNTKGFNQNIPHDNKQQDINNIRTFLGMSFDNHIYKASSDPSEAQMISKNQDQLQREYIQLIRQLDNKLESDEITDEQYNMVYASLTRLYKLYKEIIHNKLEAPEEQKRAFNHQYRTDTFDLDAEVESVEGSKRRL